MTHPVFVAKFDFRQKETPVIKARRIIHGRYALLYSSAGVHRAGLPASDAGKSKAAGVLVTVAIATVQPQRRADFAPSCATFSCPRQRIVNTQPP